jgi:hypothetical protein
MIVYCVPLTLGSELSVEEKTAISPQWEKRPEP